MGIKTCRIDERDQAAAVTPRQQARTTGLNSPRLHTFFRQPPLRCTWGPWLMMTTFGGCDGRQSVGGPERRGCGIL